MQHARTIQADGITWPVDTYIDALAFRRVDPFGSPYIDGEARLVTISIDGELRAATYASQVAWHDTLAFRAVDYSRAATPCRACGETAFNLQDDLCDSCDSDDGWFG
jgi:hypothetical protein